MSIPNSFPAMNLYCCPRFYKGLIVADGRGPLNKYLPSISTSSYTKIIQEEAPEKNEISSFELEDGLVYFLSKLTSKKKDSYYFKGIKVLICVCMYN